MAWQAFPHFDSSNIASAQYEDLEQVLEITFHNGGTYRYYDVPAHVAAGFGQAASKGGFFASHIKGHFRYAKM